MPEMKPPKIGDQEPNPTTEGHPEYSDTIKQIKKIDQYNKGIFELYPYDSKKGTEEEYYHELVTLYLKALEVKENIDQISKKDIKKCPNFSENTSELFFGLLSKKETRDFLIDSMNLEKPDRYKLQTVINELAPFLASGDDRVSSAGIREKPWREVDTIREKLLAHVGNPHASFFYSAYIKNMCEQDKYIEELHQRIVPVEVAQGVYMDTYGQEISKTGLFDELKSRLNGGDELADSDDWDDMHEYFRPLTSKDIGIKDETISSEDLEDFKFFQQKGFRGLIEKSLGVPLKELTLPEQFYLLNYLKEIPNEKSEALFSFSQKYGLPGFRTFLSIAHGGKEMGDKIVLLGKKLSEEPARVLFRTYNEIVNASEEVGALLSENLGEKATPEMLEKAKESLLVGGKNLLEKYAKKVGTCEGIDCENLGKELEEHLSLAKASIFAFSYACKTLVDRGEFAFEDFKKAKLIYDKSPIPEEMQQKIIAIHQENTKQYPESLKNFWRDTLQNGLENPNPKQLVVSVLYDSEVVSSMRVIEQENGSWYGASFNVNPTIQGSRIGTELLKKVIGDLAKDKPFIADCYSLNPMLDTYINKFGFKITKEIPNYHNTGTSVYQITLFPKEI